MAGQDIRALLLIMAAALSWLELLLSCKVIFYHLFTMDVITKWQSLEIVRSYNPWGLSNSISPSRSRGISQQVESSSMSQEVRAERPP